mgnify:CR=1 FL=1
MARNDFAEANERHLDGTKPNEPIPKLSELKKKKALKGALRGPPARVGARRGPRWTAPAARGPVN